MGPLLVGVASLLHSGFPSLDTASAVMRDLAVEVEETVLLCVWNGQAPTVLHVCEQSRRATRITIAVGTELPPTCSAARLLSSPHSACTPVADETGARLRPLDRRLQSAGPLAGPIAFDLA